MAGSSKVVLYSYFCSSCSWRVRIAIAIKGIAYDYKAVNLLKGDQFSEEFLKLNPSAPVPVLMYNRNVITHSNAILEYLEEVVPSPSLLPKNPVMRSKVRAIVDCIVSDIQRIQNIGVVKYVGDKGMEWGKHWIEKGFVAVEKFLFDTHGLYCVGDDLTLADVCLIPQVFNATNRFNVDVNQFPLISKISSRLSELPAFKVSHPFVQPDCPDDLRRQ